MSFRPLLSNELKWRSEEELILLSSRTTVDSETIARIKVLTESANEIDWDYLYQLARRHSVFPLVYTQLRATAAANVSPSQLAKLKATYHDNAAHNLVLTAELCGILRSFEAAGIEAIPYKGPALALYAYHNLALRRFVDLDILVRRADVLRAKELLVAQGFVCGTQWTRSQETLLMQTQHNLLLSREAGRIVVELHWEVASRLFASSMQTETFWERLETIDLNNLAVKSLSAEDLLLSLCVHGSKHLWERLAWICDIAELVRTRTDLDWEITLERAAASGSQRMLLLGLYLAGSLLNAPLPENIIIKLESDEKVASLAEHVSQRLFCDPEQILPSISQTFRFQWALRQDWHSRLRYCRLLLQPTEADIETVALPRRLNFVYYLMRPLELLRRDKRRREAVGRNGERSR